MTDVRSRKFLAKLFSNKMAVTTVIFWVSLVLSVIGSDGKGELIILHSPDSLGFKGASTVRESALKEIFSASLGLSVEENSEWNGMVINDPFRMPEAVCAIFVDGVSSLDGGVKGHRYPLIPDEYEPNTFLAMKHRIQQRFSSGRNNLVSMKMSNLEEVTSHSNVFGDIRVPKLQDQKYQHLTPSDEYDLNFLEELSGLIGVTDKIKAGAIKADNIIDFYNFRFTQLHPLIDVNGPNSLKAKEAKRLLGAELQRMTNAIVQTYEGSVLVAVVASDVGHITRKVRSVEEGSTNRAAKDSYPEDYAAIFNIMLWFGVVFVFVLIAIVYALMDMDPGRDSIIYRMTSTRMKKDN